MKPNTRFYLWMSLRAFLAMIVVLWLNFGEWFKAELSPGHHVWQAGWPFPVTSHGAIVAIYTPVGNLWRSVDFWIDLLVGLSIILASLYIFRNGCRPWWHWIRTVGIEDIREPD